MTDTRHLPPDMEETIQLQRGFFRSGRTRDLKFRFKQLRRLKQTIEDNQDRIYTALKQDLAKPRVEAYFTEIGFTLADLDLAVKNLKSWAKPKKVSTPIGYLPGSSCIMSEPYGNCLIIGPWNYPFNLLLTPLVGALAAGNCAVLKPSEHAPACSHLLAEMIQKTFDPGYVAVVEGGPETGQALLKEKWDYIFFSGGTAIGQIVMEAAAKHLTPITLELGGKNPCIIDKDIDLAVTARRVAWGKYYNAGQTCIAVDYVLVHEDIKEEFIGQLKETILDMYGENPQESPDLARVINVKHFSRLARLLDPNKVVIGGQHDRGAKYIAPTVMDKVTWTDPVMQEEVFGPLLPIMTYTDIDQAIDMVNAHARPLALYVFSRDRSLQNKVLAQTSSGGACINDVMVQFVPHSLPFGGVGASGMGAYHGRASFDTFSHNKSTLRRSFKLDSKIRYAPYKVTLEAAKKLVTLMTGRK